MKAALGLGLPIVGGGAWTPDDLGAALLAWWDAERVDSITQSGGAVSAWSDLVGGYAATQAVSGAKPTWDAGSFGSGRAGVTFDGADDELTLATQPASFPVGTAGCEMFALVDNTAAPADTTGRRIFTYGGATQLISRQLYRSVSGGSNRVTAAVGDGAASIAATTPSSMPLDGIHVVQAIVSATEVTAMIDGVAGGVANPAAVTPATTSARGRIGASTNASPTGFWQGVINALILTGPLSGEQRAQLTDYLKARGGLP